MRTFKDNAGREWRLAIGLATARNLKEATDGRIDVIEQSKGTTVHNLFGALAADIGLLGQVLWILCEAQAEEFGISELQFAEAFDMDALARGQDALIEAIIDFFPNRSRGLLREGAAVARAIADTEADAAETRAMEILKSPEMAAVMRAAIHGKPCSSMPEFAA